MVMSINSPFEAAPFYGKYKGYVRRNDDPERRGRLRCYCPQVMGIDDDESHWLGWAEAHLPWMGGTNVLHGGPPLTRDQTGGVDTIGVWLEFEGGNLDFPIWTGTWLVAPTPTGPNAQQVLSEASGVTGGSLIENPPPGSKVDDINPPKPLEDSTELRLVVKAGQEIVLASAQGGYIMIGPYGVSITGIQVLINGKLIDASSADGAIG